MAIAVLVLWAFTAGAGLFLLTSVSAARRLAAGQPGDVRSDDARSDDARCDDVRSDGEYPASWVPVLGTPMAPRPRRVIASRPKLRSDDHPALEFFHPALAFAGLAFWFAYVLTRAAGAAWIAFAVQMVAVAAGVTWLITTTRASRARERADKATRGGRGGRGGQPARLILLHGLAAAGTVTLTVLTAIAAGRS